MASFPKAKSGWLNRRLSRLWRLRLMTCPVCGKPQPCAHNRRNTAVALDRAVVDEGGVPPYPWQAQGRADQMYWRQEIASRVQQHRARRRRRFDANASLELDFPATAAAEVPAQIAGEPPLPSQVDKAAQAGDQFSDSAASAPPAEPHKIIRFPRIMPRETVLASRPFVDELELADPAPETPRILEAPEPQQMDLLAAFTDLQLDESAPDPEDLGLPPQPAPLHRRFLASLVDTVIVLAATAVFAAAFVKVSAASIIIQGRAARLGIAAVVGILWLLFHYIFLAYGRGTPGMRSTGLELCTFAGEQPSLMARRYRALAMLLSALSLGLGFAWALVDEDTLGWHDRISGTYIRNSTQHSAVSTQPH